MPRNFKVPGTFLPRTAWQKSAWHLNPGDCVYLILLSAIGSLSFSVPALATPDERPVCGQVDAYDLKAVLLVRRMIYQPGTDGSYYGAGRTYRLIEAEAGPRLSDFKKHHGKYICIRGFDFSESESWTIAVTAIE